MKGNIRRKKKHFWKPVAAGFTVMYLVIMGLVTWLVKGKFTAEYDQMYETIVSSLQNEATDKEMTAQQEGWNGNERKKYYLSLADQFFLAMDEPYVQFSAAFYDENQKLLAKTSDAIDGMATVNSVTGTGESYILDEFLSDGQKEELAGYYSRGLQESLESAYLRPEKYRFSIQSAPDGQGLWGIFIQQVTWEEGQGDPPYYTDPLDGTVHQLGMTQVDYETGKETGEVSFYETASEIVWEWDNPDISDEERKKGSIQSAVFFFPYIRSSYESWQQWNSSEYLHGFPEKGDFEWEDGIDAPVVQTESDSYYYRVSFPLKIGYIDEPYAYLEVRMEARPWLAALDSMKYVCLAGSVLSLACMAAIIYMLNRTYDRQAALDETRRDLTNAMAHELKTPLGIIRNFAENLFEHNMEEKRDYYISQIIGQTEEMDHLVAEMIEISKLDSEEFRLKKETVSFSKLVRQQAGRFEPIIREKNILVRFDEGTDFQIEGDREYLARAIWNLLSNAVDYNLPDGNILIKIDSDICTIENTGAPLDEEQLAHAFDLFYTSNKSRGGKEKHMGMGLFLTKKILLLHGMSIELENTVSGIRAVIKK